MAGVRLFGRHWSVSTDDWVFPSFIELILRIIWLVVLLSVTLLHLNLADCNSKDIYRIFFIGLLSCLVLNVPCTLGLMLVSARGSVLRGRDLRLPWVPLFLYLKLFLYICELAWVGLGLYWAFVKEVHCDWALVVVVRVIVIMALVFALFNAINVWLIFDPLGATAHPKRCEDLTKAQKVWERRCRIICCGCAPKDRERDAFSSIAHLLTEYFADMDLTPSDIAAGLLLLRRRQEEELIASESDVALLQQDMTTAAFAEEDWLRMSTILRAMEFALACYGWPVYIMMNMCKGGCCRLCGLCRCSCCACAADDDGPAVIDDNCCQCNFAAVLKITGLKRSHILHVTFHNDLFESPYFVAVDHNFKTITVAVRGSLSLSDGLTDLSAVVGSLEPEGYEDFVAHGGILQSARYICQRLLESGILSQALEHFPDYKLVLAGHSLGAGIVSVLAVLLKEHFPFIKSYAFSPPLGLMNEKMATFCEDFVLSVSVGYDLVPRLSIRNMYALKRKVLDVLNRTTQPKFKIMGKGLFRLCCGRSLSRSQLSVNTEESLLTPDSHPTYDATHDALMPPNDQETASRSPEEQRVRDHPKLQFAGRMLHLIDTEDTFYGQLDPAQSEEHVAFRGDLCTVSCRSRGEYRAVWSDASKFEEIIIHPRMVTDHLPDRVQAALHFVGSSGRAPILLERPQPS